MDQVPLMWIPRCLATSLTVLTESNPNSSRSLSAVIEICWPELSSGKWPGSGGVVTRHQVTSQVTSPHRHSTFHSLKNSFTPRSAGNVKNVSRISSHTWTRLRSPARTITWEAVTLQVNLDEAIYPRNAQSWRDSVVREPQRHLDARIWIRPDSTSIK